VAGLRRALMYLHVPFCEAKCHYCNFAVDVRRDPGLHRGYVDALVLQAARVLRVADPRGVRSPGSTSAAGRRRCWPTAELERVLRAVAPLLARAEVGTRCRSRRRRGSRRAEPDKLAMMRDLGVARVSVGIQSTNDEVLAEVNRGAQRALADAALAGLMRAGFRRVHVDLVFGLPGQTPAAWREDLLRVVAHGVDSITTYDCLYRGQGRALPHRMDGAADDGGVPGAVRRGVRAAACARVRGAVRVAELRAARG
jgi:oxygen-independent coproporphyrinogen-3 oxidase